METTDLKVTVKTFVRGDNKIIFVMLFYHVSFSSLEPIFKACVKFNMFNLVQGISEPFI